MMGEKTLKYLNTYIHTDVQKNVYLQKEYALDFHDRLPRGK